MIKYIKGDLFQDDHVMIAHGCNAQGVMGSGFALEIKQRFPDAYEAYYRKCAQTTNRISLLGDVIPVYTTIGKIIFNCITQGNYGKDGTKYVSYDAVDTCMKYIGESQPKWHIAMPKIGAGLGGGNWEVIEAIINHRLKDVDVRVYEL